MIQMSVCLWQVDQQAYHPLAFYLGAQESHQVPVDTVEIVASAA